MLKQDVSAPSREFHRWLALAALIYSLTHHLGLLPGGLGEVGQGTRWVDWIDLTVPYSVLIFAGLALRAARARASHWWAFAWGALAYANGHGMHLAANSINNVGPTPTANLWDEYVGHAVWYIGVALVVASLMMVMRLQAFPCNPWAWLLAFAVGTTWGTNALGGHFLWPGLALALTAIGVSWRYRHTQMGLVGIGLVPGVTIMLAGVVGVIER
jgi:hypothetical protein